MKETRSAKKPTTASKDEGTTSAQPTELELPVDGGIRLELPGFEGPLDLLLHLIQEHELDILNIPIAFITKKYLEYIQMMEQLNIDIASEYLVMAATLAHIKSRSLLPTPPAEQDEGEEEELDPRAELIRRLLEYQKYKKAGEELATRSVLGRDVFVRGALPATDPSTAPLAPVSSFKLLEAFQRVLSRAKIVIDHQIEFERFSLSDRINQLVDLLKDRGRVLFEDLFEGQRSRADLVVTFLALLELTRLRMTRLYQDHSLDPIYVELAVVDENGNAVPAAPESPTESTSVVSPTSEQPSPAALPKAEDESDEDEDESDEDEDEDEDVTETALSDALGDAKARNEPALDGDVTATALPEETEVAGDVIATHEPALDGDVIATHEPALDGDVTATVQPEETELDGDVTESALTEEVAPNGDVTATDQPNTESRELEPAGSASPSRRACQVELPPGPSLESSGQTTAESDVRQALRGEKDRDGAAARLDVAVSHSETEEEPEPMSARLTGSRISDSELHAPETAASSHSPEIEGEALSQLSPASEAREFGESAEAMAVGMGAVESSEHSLPALRAVEGVHAPTLRPEGPSESNDSDLPVEAEAERYIPTLRPAPDSAETISSAPGIGNKAEPEHALERSPWRDSGNREEGQQGAVDATTEPLTETLRPAEPQEGGAGEEAELTAGQSPDSKAQAVPSQKMAAEAIEPCGGRLPDAEPLPIDEVVVSSADSELEQK